MPAFNGNQNVLATMVLSGDTINLFANETLTNGEQSIVIAPADAARPRTLIQWQAEYAGSATTINIYGSNTYPTSSGPDPNGVLVGTLDNNPAGFSDNSGFAFYWAQAAAANASGVTVSAHVR